MLTPDKMTKAHVSKLLDLIESHTRSDISARIGPIPDDVRLSVIDDMVEALDDLRKFVFGTSDIVELGYQFGILKHKTKKAKKKVKRKERV